MIFNLGTGKYPFDLSYSGNWSGIKGDPMDNWYAIFTGGGTLNVNMAPSNIDLFLVGGGQSGSTGGHWNEDWGNYWVEYWNSGKAGDGGKILTQNNYALTEGTNYLITIGQGGEGNLVLGGSSSFKNSSSGEIISSSNGSIYGAGGRGSINADTYSSSGGDGIYAFSDSNLNGIKYGAGGGGGGSIRWAEPHMGGTAHYVHGPSAGGETGGGDGARGGGDYDYNSTPGNGQANTGAGGGSAGSSGKGGSGVIIIRNHRE